MSSMPQSDKASMDTLSPVDSIASIVYGGSPTELRMKFLKEVFKGEEDAAKKALWCLTSGGETTQQIVAIQIDSIVDRVAREHNPKKPRNDVYTSITRVLKEILVSYYVAEVITETSVSYADSTLFGRVMRAAALKGNEFVQNPLDSPASYWRGLVIMAAAGMDSGKDIALHSNDFALWAGAQPHPGRIIQLVRDRKTLDVPTLTALLVQQESGHSAVSNGYL